MVTQIFQLCYWLRLISTFSLKIPCNYKPNFSIQVSIEQITLLEENWIENSVFVFLELWNLICDGPKFPNCAVSFDSSPDTNTLFYVTISLISFMET